MDISIPHILAHWLELGAVGQWLVVYWHGIKHAAAAAAPL